MLRTGRLGLGIDPQNGACRLCVGSTRREEAEEAEEDGYGEQRLHGHALTAVEERPITATPLLVKTPEKARAEPFRQPLRQPALAETAATRGRRTLAHRNSETMLRARYQATGVGELRRSFVPSPS
jgi:hypothetical protein